MKNQIDSSSTLRPTSPGETQASFHGALPGIHEGIVVNRDDPNKQHRVQVQASDIYGDIPQPNLPWMEINTPVWGTSDKGRPAGGGVAVPPLGSKVRFMFRGGDHRYPVVIGSSYGTPGFTNTMPDHSFAKNGNSPDNFSYTTPRGTCIQLDERAGKEKALIILPEGDYVAIDKQGLIEVSANKTVSIKAATLVSIQCDTQVQVKAKEVLLYGTTDLVLEGATSVNINSDSVVNVQAPKINLNCGSSKTAIADLKKVDTVKVYDGA